MEDAVLYVDADALFLNPVENIWDVFEKMNDSHLMALGHEIEDEANNWYKLEAKHPFVPPFGTYLYRLPLLHTLFSCFELFFIQKRKILVLLSKQT